MNKFGGFFYPGIILVLLEHYVYTSLLIMIFTFHHSLPYITWATLHIRIKPLYNIIIRGVQKSDVFTPLAKSRSVD